MWCVVRRGFEHHGKQLHPGDRVWLPRGLVVGAVNDGRVQLDPEAVYAREGLAS